MYFRTIGLPKGLHMSLFEEISSFCLESKHAEADFCTWDKIHSKALSECYFIFFELKWWEKDCFEKESGEQVITLLFRSTACVKHR